MCFMLGGCGISNKVNIVENDCLRDLSDSYYLCAASVEHDAGITLLDFQNNVIFQCKNARIEYCVSDDGEFLDKKAGEIPKDTILFVEMFKFGKQWGMGVWDCGECAWIIEPMEGFLSFSSDNGRMDTFSIGTSGCYNFSTRTFTEKAERIYILSNGLQLENGYDTKGNECVYESNGERYIIANSFYINNRNAGIKIDRPDDIRIYDVVESEYIIIECSKLVSVGDGLKDTLYWSYLCDSTGNILFSEWDYDYVEFVKNQFGETNRQILKFGRKNGMDYHFVDVSTMEEIIIPDGYNDAVYMNKGYFLLDNGMEEYIIYDSETQMKGDTINKNDFSSILANSFHVFGTHSYMIQNQGKLVIEGMEKDLLDETEILVTVPGDYDVVKAGKLGGPYHTNYIFDSFGNLMLQTSENVVCADEERYLVLKNNKYILYSYGKLY